MNPAAMPTIEIALDGYTDLPPGKIANVVTYFEMLAPPSRKPVPAPAGLVVRTVSRPGLAWYRDLYRRIGEDWLWFARAVMPNEELATLLTAPSTEIVALERDDDLAIGLAELRRQDDEVEIAMFGVVPEVTGTGAARFLMQAALEKAWSGGVARVWLHTCSFDHPAAVRFYARAGFTAFKFAIEVADDPRLTGHLAETAGPHVPLIRPKA
ncbi:MAG: GNAT family N-acetyltransferase [Bauldia sp.]